MTEDRKNTDQTTTNAELVQAALSGDHDAWERLVRRYDTALHRVARSFRVDQATADDAVQTTWLRLVEHLDSLRDPDRLGSWLITTVRRRSSPASPTIAGGPAWWGWTARTRPGLAVRLRNSSPRMS